MDVLPTFGGALRGPRFPPTKAGWSVFALKNADAPLHRDHLIVQLHGGAGFPQWPQALGMLCGADPCWCLIHWQGTLDIQQDPSQRTDVSAANPDVVKQLRAMTNRGGNPFRRMTPVPISLGDARENPTRLCSQDWYLASGNPPWNFGEIGKLPRVTGSWMVNIKKAGRYRLTLGSGRSRPTSL